MSLNISFCLQSNFLSNHSIDNFLMILENNTIITSAKDGNLII